MVARKLVCEGSSPVIAPLAQGQWSRLTRLAACVNCYKSVKVRFWTTWTKDGRPLLSLKASSVLSPLGGFVNKSCGTAAQGRRFRRRAKQVTCCEIPGAISSNSRLWRNCPYKKQGNLTTNTMKNGSSKCASKGGSTEEAGTRAKLCSRFVPG